MYSLTQTRGPLQQSENTRPHLNFIGIAFCILLLGTNLSSSYLVAQNTPPTFPAKITSIQDLWDADNLASDIGDLQTVPIELSFTVLFHDPEWNLLWVEEKGIGAFVPMNGQVLSIRTGEKVVLSGEYTPGSGLEASRLQCKILETNIRPEVIQISDRMTDPESIDVKYISTEGYVTSQQEVGGTHLKLEMIAFEKRIECYALLDPSIPNRTNYTDTFIQVEGLHVASRGPGGQIEGSAIWVADIDQLTLGGNLLGSAFEYQATRIADLENLPAEHPVRVIGVVYSQDSGKFLTIRDDTGQLILSTQQAEMLQTGSFVEAIGFPNKEGFSWTLRDAIYKPIASESAQKQTSIDSSSLNKLMLVEQVLRLESSNAAEGLPVELSGKVVFIDPKGKYLFMTDSTGGIRINLSSPSEIAYTFGDAVHVSGYTEMGKISPAVKSDNITLTGSRSIPATRKITLDRAESGAEESQWVELVGYLRKIEYIDEWTIYHLTESTGEFTAIIPTKEGKELDIGSILRIQGICSTSEREGDRLGKVQMLLGNKSQLTTLRDALNDPYSSPVISVDSLKSYRTLRTWDKLVQVKGVVENQVLGRYVLVNDGRSILKALSRSKEMLNPGELVDVVGIPGHQRANIILRESIFRQTGHTKPTSPISAPENMEIDPNFEGRFVKFEGLLLNTSYNEDKATLLIQTPTTTVSAIYTGTLDNRYKDTWETGSEIEISAIYGVEYDEFDRPYELVFQLRSPDDLKISKSPAWLNAKRATLIVLISLAALILGLLWAATLRRKVAIQTHTIRKKIEKESQLEASHREIVKNASDFIFTIDLDGKFKSFNPAGEKLTGYNVQTALSKSIFDLLKSSHRNLLKDQISESLNNEDSDSSEYEIVTCGGSSCWVEANLRCYTETETGSTGILGVMRDISGRKKVEEELTRARDAAEENTRAKSSFFASMSHELRTPMNGVIGMSNILMDTDLTEDQASYTTTIRDSAESLLTLLNDILDLSKAEAGKLQIEPYEFELEELLSQTIDLLGTAASAKKLKLGYDLEALTKLPLIGDGGRLRQILLNLVGNAIKFTDRGSVQISAKTKRSSDKNIELLFEISDTGIGIPQNTIERLFNPFVQADGSHARRFGGTGLGLAISKQIVELMNGEIGVRSETGKGSVFWFSLQVEKISDPDATCENVNGEISKSAKSSAKAKEWKGLDIRILIAEDIPVNQKVTKIQLKKIGFENADIAENGEKVIEALNQKHYDLILMDCQMPLMDGFETTQILRANPKYRNIPIIALTANAMEGDRKRCLEVGMNDYVSKPTNTDKLREAICKIEFASNIGSSN